MSIKNYIDWSRLEYTYALKYKYSRHTIWNQNHSYYFFNPYKPVHRYVHMYAHFIKTVYVYKLHAGRYNIYL